jgi:hypothetical protein
MTGDPTYDAAFGLPAREHERLHFHGTFGDLLDQLERMRDRLRVNFDLYTREVLQTDRAPLPGADLAFAAFTGAVRPWGDAGVPTMAVTWAAPHPRFAALVVNSSPDHLRVWVYNGDEKPLRLGAQLWQLLPGEYVVRCGPIGSGEGLARRYHWKEPARFTVRHRAEVYWIDAPPRQEYCVDFRLVQASPRPAILPDPAICRSDVRVQGTAAGTWKVTARIHNLGSVPVDHLEVALVEGTGSKRKIMAKTVIPRLPAIRNFEPAVVEVTFTDVQDPCALLLVIDPDHKAAEINTSNNSVDVL